MLPHFVDDNIVNYSKILLHHVFVVQLTDRVHTVCKEVIMLNAKMVLLHPEIFPNECKHTQFLQETFMAKTGGKVRKTEIPKNSGVSLDHH